MNVGFDVETAPNGIQVLLRAKRCRPDVLVIDVNMPEASGLLVCAHLRGSENTFDVIVVTGNRDQKTVEHCAVSCDFLRLELDNDKSFQNGRPLDAF